MKLVRIIIVIFMLFMNVLRVNAEGYSMLVIPKGSVAITKRATFGNVDIEELLARKFIDKLEDSDIGYAPTLRVLKISINNNSAINVKNQDYLSNIRTISRAYGVPRVLYIHSKKELINPTSQKEFWNKMDLPVLTQSDTAIKITTIVTLYDTKKDEIVYTDVFYKKMSLAEGANNTRLSNLNNYYDGLISNVFNNIKENKETHAIMVSNKSQLSKDTSKQAQIKDFKKVAQIPKKSFISDIKMKINDYKTNQEIVNITKEKQKQEKEISKKVIKPDLKMRENAPKKKSAGLIVRLKESVQPKNDLISQELKQKEKQIELDRKNDLKIREEQKKKLVKEQIRTTKTAKKILKEKENRKVVIADKKKIEGKSELHKEQGWEIPIKKISYDEKSITEKTKQVENMNKKNTDKNYRLKEENIQQKKFVLKKNDEKAVKSHKVVKAESEKVRQETIKQDKTGQASIQTKAVQKNKIARIKLKKEKTNKHKFSDILKAKIKDYKSKRALRTAEKALENNKKQQHEVNNINNILIQSDEDYPSANRYIQTRMRNNAKFYTPKYDYSVNDI